MDLPNIHITQLIPQRPPFVMVDKILSCDKTAAKTQFEVRADNIFLDNGKLSAAGMIEHMAQSCAARMGCLDRMNDEPIKIGYIGDIRNCQILRYPDCGETLLTLVTIVEEVFHLTLAQVTVSVGEEVIATANMKIAMTDIVSKG